MRASCLALLMYAGLAGQALAQQDPAVQAPGSAGYDEITKLLDSIQTRVDEMNASTKDADAAMAFLSDQVEAAIRKLSSRETENTSLRETASGLTQELKTVAMTRDALGQQVTRLTEEKDVLLERLEHQVSELASLLSLEHEVTGNLRRSLDARASELRASLDERDRMTADLSEVRGTLAEQRAERDDVIVALGGGVVCDLAGYVAATVFAFPHPVPQSIGDGVVDLGSGLAWWSPALLMLALEGLSPGRAGRAAFGAALISHALILHWLYVVTVVYGGAPPLAGILAPLGAGAYVAAFTGVFGVGWALLGRLEVATPWSAAALWTALDHFRSFALSGFPWATLGYAQHQNGALLALAPYTGVYGLSFVTVLAGALLAGLLRDLRARRRPGAGFWAGAAAVIVFHGVGVVDRTRDSEVEMQTVRVAVLQGNIDQKVKWSATRAEEILRVYETLTRRAAAVGAQIIVWPESSVPGGIDTGASTPHRLASLARETGAVLVLGAGPVGLSSVAFSRMRGAALLLCVGPP
ncbi:MAG: hypothetical protein IH924_07240, partial [Proteobacteria bacterium]|nr:hypothetical protein [Pseudomonadota bacterium]